MLNFVGKGGGFLSPLGLNCCYWIYKITSSLGNFFSFFSLFQIASQEFYTDNPKTFADYGRIINQQHFKRLMALMEGGKVAVGGDSDESECYIGKFFTHLKCLCHFITTSSCCKKINICAFSHFLNISPLFLQPRLC